MEIRGHHMPLQGKKSSEYFRVFSELHKIGGVKDKQARYITCFVSYWVYQHHPRTRDKQGF